MLREHAIPPEAVTFIAHSTTQATNALLEGDVARVGIVRFGSAFARASMRFAPVPLAPGVTLAATYFDAAGSSDDAFFERARGAGIGALVASEAFAVDRPQHEDAFVAAARARGFAATCGSEVSTMYGLRARTRTAALNAAILPRMLRTARMTRKAVDDARIPAPLMIMRSDGGVMDVREMQRRPILTMLSGPAAGVAGALLHENVTDGIFIEVGGTSADCSVIRRGRPQMRPARIGGHRTLLRTLDVRTLAIAGGSLAHVAGGGVTAVGPRSAHIAGYRYATFCDVAAIAGAHVALDEGIAALADATGRIAITPTCAANALGLVPPAAFAFGNAESARLACARVGEALGMTGDALARAILERATAILKGAIDELIADYELERATVVLVGGGGGAAALIPFAAGALGLEFRIARDAEVISPLGVALALVRDVVERTIVDPTPADLVRIRREAIDAAIRAGRRIRIGSRSSSTSIVSRNRARLEQAGCDRARRGCDRRNGRERRRTHRCGAARAARGGGAGHCADAGIHRGGRRARSCDRRRTRGRAVDRRAGRGDRRDGRGLEAAIAATIEEQTTYGDVGRALPDLWLLAGARIVELTGLSEAAGATALAADDVAGLPADAILGIVAVPRRA